MPDTKLDILPEHQAWLDERAVGKGIAKARGYRSLRAKARLKELGFSAAQGGGGPWLLIPLYSPGSDNPTGMQVRPTTPRITGSGPVKYEQPKGANPVLDINPLYKDRLTDPAVPLWITEGTMKADALSSTGRLSMSILGVHGWKLGRAPHEDWSGIPLMDREVVLAFDSDAWTKAKVHKALADLRSFLIKRKAKVKILVLPVPEGDLKLGVDDYLAMDESHAETLDALLVEELPPAPDEGPESFHPLTRITDDGEEIPLANFDARIVGQVVKDNGIEGEEQVAFELAARLPTMEKPKLTILTPDEFESMRWHLDLLGKKATLHAGSQVRDQARFEIQVRSLNGSTPDRSRRVFTHMGWRKIGDEWFYLTPGGAIGKDGFRDDLDVDLPLPLHKVRFPQEMPKGAKDPDRDPNVQAIRDSLSLIDPDMGVMNPLLYFAMFRSVIGGTDYGIWMTGNTGVGKSEIAALVQQHWGPEFDARNFSANWHSTPNFLNELGFAAKDMPLVLDDYRPAGPRFEQERMHQMADRLFRAQGNQQGRGRLSRTLDFQEGHPIRSMLLVTAEDDPPGESVKARSIYLRARPNGEEWWEKLTYHQAKARSGQYAHAMALFIRDLAEHLPRFKQRFLESLEVAKGEIPAHGHRRTSMNITQVIVFTRVITLPWMVNRGVLSQGQAATYLAHLIEEAQRGSVQQQEVQWEDSVVGTAQTLLRSALMAGRARIDGVNFETAGDQEGEWIGFILPSDKEVTNIVYSKLHGLIRREARLVGESFPWTQRRLGSALQDSKILLNRGSDSIASPRKYGNKNYRVLQLPTSFIADFEEGADLNETVNLDIENDEY